MKKSCVTREQISDSFTLSAANFYFSASNVCVSCSDGFSSPDGNNAKGCLAIGSKGESVILTISHKSIQYLPYSRSKSATSATVSPTVSATSSPLSIAPSTIFKPAIDVALTLANRLQGAVTSLVKAISSGVRAAAGKVVSYP